eukprot:s4700_g1.t1
MFPDGAGLASTCPLAYCMKATLLESVCPAAAQASCRVTVGSDTGSAPREASRAQVPAEKPNQEKPQLASALLATIPGIPAVMEESCRFSCLGCTAKGGRQHEEEAVVEHVNQLLEAVLALRRSVRRLELVSEGIECQKRPPRLEETPNDPPWHLPPLPPVKDELPPPQEPAPAPAAVEQLLPASPSLPPAPAAPGNPEPAGHEPEEDPPALQAEPQPEPSEPPKAAIEVPRPAWEEQIQIRVEPPETEVPRQLPQGPKPMWQEMMESQDPPMPPPLQPPAQQPSEQVQLPPIRPSTGGGAAPAEQGVISDTGQMDLLRLLQGTQEEVLPPVMPEATGPPVASTRPFEEVSTAELAAARTLVLPGMKQVPAPEARDEQGTREARSIAAALLQTTPPSVGVEDQLLQAEKEERREFEARQAAAAAAAEEAPSACQNEAQLAAVVAMDEEKVLAPTEMGPPEVLPDAGHDDEDSKINSNASRASDRISILLVIITLFVIIPAVVIVILIVTMSLLIFCLPAFRYHRLVSIMLATPTLLITFERPEVKEALATLNRATAQLQKNELSHAEAARTFSRLVAGLSPGRLRCSALLNRAHCYVGMGLLQDALADIQEITNLEGATDGFDASRWPKVWMSRGGIHRKSASDAYMAKARRCLAQLESGEEPRGRLSVGEERAELQKLQIPSPRSKRPSTSPSPVAKRARLENSSRSRSASPAPDGLQQSPQHCGLKVVRRALEALGDDCITAGRLLFQDASVNDGSVVPKDIGGEASAAPTVPATASTAPTRRSGVRRLFEVRGPFGPPEQVTLQLSDDLGAECSCRLQGHCKHVAAALCALEKDEGSTVIGTSQEEKDAAFTAPATAPPEPLAARPADSSARRQLEATLRHLDRKTNDELKSYLRLNNQLLSGAKPDLRLRVADGAVFGALAPCPKCGGHLHPEEPGQAPNTMYFCKRILRDREACGFQVYGTDAERRPFLGAEDGRPKASSSKLEEASAPQPPAPVWSPPAVPPARSYHAGAVAPPHHPAVASTTRLSKSGLSTSVASSTAIGAAVAAVAARHRQRRCFGSNRVVLAATQGDEIKFAKAQPPR